MLSSRLLRAKIEPPADPSGSGQRRDTEALELPPGLALLAITALIGYLCWILVRPFLAPLVWAYGFAVLARPLYVRINGRLSASLAALVTVCLVGSVILAPLAILIQRVAHEAVDLANSIPSQTYSGLWTDFTLRLPWLAGAAEWIQARLNLDSAFRQFAGVLGASASSIVSRSVKSLGQIPIMILALFYFLRDRDFLLRLLYEVIPLAESECRILFDRVTVTVSTTLAGNVAVKLLQGLLGGFMLWLVGLPAPAFWGAVMAACAVIPLLGTAFVWIPGVVALVAQGHGWKALALGLWGGLVVSQIDNLLYPLLLGTALRLHTLGVFLAILGGLIAFGISGVVLGPVILALAIGLGEIWNIRRDSQIVDHSIDKSATSGR
jgi:predicted PurR-regulated permease PerM